RRTMSEIAAGKKPGPKPFILATKKQAASDAVWRSHRSASAQGAKAASSGSMPSFVPPQLCRLVNRPPNGAEGIHEVKFDGYRMQLGVAGDEAVLRSRGGLDWTQRFPAIAEAARQLPACLIDGEIVALNDQGAPDFAGLQAALSEGNPADLIF